MHLRLFRRVKIAPGVTLNLSRSSPSLSLGPRGARMTMSSRGRRLTVGAPGTGIYATDGGAPGHPSPASSTAGLIAAVGLAAFKMAMKSTRHRR